MDTPAFQGSGVEPNALERLLATPVKGGSGPAVVGKDTVTSKGDYEVVSAALRDGTYGFAVRLEDLAGNVSQPSPTLAVTTPRRSGSACWPAAARTGWTSPSTTRSAPSCPCTADRQPASTSPRETS
uniref:Ig-like domain-containing protein n=1 Tax=Streptomyces sp. NBC_01001 TaxID=2903713 RepID=UPI003BAAE5E1